MALTTSGLLTVGDTYVLTGTTVDFEAYKTQINNVLKNYVTVGNYTIDIALVSETNGVATFKATIQFEAMADACQFAYIFDPTNVPAFCDIYRQPNTSALNY